MAFEAISKCELEFVQESVRKKLRLDGREFDQFRNLRINFGSDWGCVYVCLGETTVMTSVSCSIVEPKTSKPVEGLLHINVESSPTIRKQFTANAHQELIIKISRFLDRTIKDSKCIDLESLCILADEKVWEVKCNIVLISNEGNMLDCASIATICALANFRMPDAQLEGRTVRIPTESERPLLPLVVHHYPVCVSYSLFEKGTIAVPDPTIVEERCREGLIVFAVNGFQELCSLNYSGSVYTNDFVVLSSAVKAAKRVKVIVDEIKECIKNHELKRSREEICTLAECLREKKLCCPIEDRLQLRLSKFEFEKCYVPEYAKQKESPAKIGKLAKDIVMLNSQPGGSWLESTNDDVESEGDDDDEDDSYNEIATGLF